MNTFNTRRPGPVKRDYHWPDASHPASHCGTKDAKDTKEVHLNRLNPESPSSGNLLNHVRPSCSLDPRSRV